ncbi:hypothetical protein [Phyllobacterium myrsinacearum]|uniref:Uncharacterized protein n=1 Tax=Phyllobacterium myrsinacearum TaxID=28101 RepID=A0A839EXA5_9HYPH|nr:hypothetical protein [Phyllobacterium myrsinacearum]MBA8881017.1 hypothetical protein [Phyllobacterium myrsinacearum]
MAIKFTAKDPAPNELPVPAKVAKPAKIEPDAVDSTSDVESADSDLFNAASKLPPRKRKGK